MAPGECHFPYRYKVENSCLSTLTHRSGSLYRGLITGIFDRLHNARFTQGSVFWRNILIQPGPLTKPHAERSQNSPSFRLIDFGRGECFDSDGEAADKIESEKWLFRHLCGDLY